MKRFCLVCAIFALAVLIACGSDSEKAEEQTQSPAQQSMSMEKDSGLPTKLRISLMWMMPTI